MLSTSILFIGRLVLTISLTAANWFLLLTSCVVLLLIVVQTRTEKEKLLARFGNVDVGFGARLAITGMPSIFKVDATRGLRDSATVVSFVYEP